MLLLLYETVLRCNYEPGNLENNVWIAEFYPGYEHMLQRGSNSTMNNKIYDNDRNHMKAFWSFIDIYDIN